MVMIGGNLYIKMYGLGRTFQYEEKNYMLAEALEEYELACAELAYEDPEEHATMGLIAS